MKLTKNNIQEHLKLELGKSRGVVSLGKEVVPRFLVFLPDGEQTILNPLPDDEKARYEPMALVRRYMVWKMARGFVFSSETIKPEALFSVAVWRDGAGEVEANGLYLAKTSKNEYADAVTIGTAEAGELLELLPNRNEQLTEAEINELKTLMGEGGVFEVMPKG